MLQGAAGKLAADQTRFNFGRDLKTAINRMKMGKAMLSVEHSNNDSQEPANFWHIQFYHRLAGVEISENLPNKNKLLVG